MANILNSLVKTLYTPDSDDPAPGAMYPRVIYLEHGETDNGCFLATFEQYKKDRKPVFPIFKSEDLGQTWKLVSVIEDTENSWGLRYQPHLYELPEAVGGMPAGTIIAAGNSIPDDMSRTKIDLYKSDDRGLTWSFLSSVAEGGPARVYEDPVWEPFLLTDGKGRLICYYSDERRKADGYNQLLAHRVTTNGIDWDSEVYDVAVPDGVSRPGMAVVSRLPNGKFMMTYEVVDAQNKPNCPVYYKLSPDGLDWGNPAYLGKRVQTADGLFLGSTPYHIWLPHAGSKGMILVSAKGYRDDGSTVSTSVHLANYKLGEGDWHKVNTSLSHNDNLWFTGWSRTLAAFDDGQKVLQLSPVQINDSQAEIRSAIMTLNASSI